MGYFPKKKGRQTMIKTISQSEYPVFFYESPHRIQKTLTLLCEGLEGFDILIGREMTKKFEEVIFCHLLDYEIIDNIKPQGEFVFCIVKGG
jgi:16S rRNA (cytidine1402-2'-O)-methyltransferase